MSKKKEAKAAENKGGQPEFVVHNILLSDASFEAAAPLHLLKDEWKPSANIECKSKHRALSENDHEVVLTVKVTVTVAEKTVFVVEVHQMGVFGIKNLEGQQLEHVLEVFCPTTLLPYARESVSSFVGRGGYPPFYLGPFDFEAQYQQRLQEQASSN